MLRSFRQRGITGRRHLPDLEPLSLDARHSRSHPGIHLVDFLRSELHAFQQQAFFLKRALQLCFTASTPGALVPDVLQHRL
ncbi:hypothetical protein D3C87_1671700 [compost metagenome]